MAEVLKINPRSVDALTATAAILDNSGRKDEARDAFERALAVEPENKFLRVGYAGNLATSGRLEDAVRTYEVLVKDYPKDIALWRSLGIAYGTGGDYDRAIESFKQITFLQPTPDAYFNLALSYRQKGDAVEAARYFELYLEKAEGEPEGKIRTARNELERLRALRRP
jgi:tetratricopeptide (TPR) repeat protein